MRSGTYIGLRKAVEGWRVLISNSINFGVVEAPIVLAGAGRTGSADRTGDWVAGVGCVRWLLH